MEYLSCVRRGLLVWTGVDGPDISDGVEHAAWPSLWTLLKEPWVMCSLQPTLSPELLRPSDKGRDQQVTNKKWELVETSSTFTGANKTRQCEESHYGRNV